MLKVKRFFARHQIKIKPIANTGLLSEIALVLTNLEAIVGQMYPAIFIAILVGGYLSKRSEE